MGVSTVPRWTDVAAPSATEGLAERSRFLLVPAAIVVGVVGAGLAVFGGIYALMALLGLGYVIAVLAKPEFAAYTFVGLLPFLSGVERGAVVPGLRLTEVLLTATVGTVFLHYLIGKVTGRAGGPWMTQLHAAFLAMAFLASVWPILWMAIRGLVITGDDLLATLPLWKYFALFVVIRRVVRTVDQVRAALVIGMISAAITGLAAIGQTVGVGPVISFLELYWKNGGDTLDDGRGSSFLGNPIATASYCSYYVGVALAWLIRDRGDRRWLTPLMGLLSVGVLGTGQFSGVASLIGVIASLALVSGAVVRVARWMVMVSPFVIAAAWPAVMARLSEPGNSYSVLPNSWLVRWDNLVNYYWSDMFPFNWILGVGPESVRQPLETWRDIIYLESGYTWLLLVGGVPLFFAFLYFMRLALRSTYIISRSREDAAGVAATATFALLCTIAVLSTLDMHLTTRGEAETAYVLLALSLVPYGTNDLRRILQPFSRRGFAADVA